MNRPRSTIERGGIATNVSGFVVVQATSPNVI
jgi:hypothetical protein